MKILLGVTGSIAAYKIPELVKLLRRDNHEVKVIATRGALQFVTSMTLSICLGGEVYIRDIGPQMLHIRLAKWADIVLIAPATANIIAKIACGLADDLLSTTCLATEAKLFIAPAMNCQMWSNLAVQENIAKLRGRGVEIISPTVGLQACGDYGQGRMMEINDIANIFRVPIDSSIYLI